MTGGNYQLLFKVLGKLAKMYDAAGAGGIGTPLAAVTVDQVADQDVWELDKIMSSFNQALDGAINSAANAAAQQQALVLRIAGAYLLSETVNGYFTTPPDAATAALVVAALAAEMTTNTVTVTTRAATGIANLLHVINAAASIPQAADASATYKDSVYCVSTLV